MILIVDDHVDTGTVLARLLRKDGHDAVAVSTGATALSLLRTARPAVVVLDKAMPGIDGLDVLRWMRSDAVARSIPVILYSADVDPESADEARRLGADAYLMKAVTPWEQVRATVGRYADA